MLFKTVVTTGKHVERVYSSLASPKPLLPPMQLAYMAPLPYKHLHGRTVPNSPGESQVCPEQGSKNRYSVSSEKPHVPSAEPQPVPCYKDSPGVEKLKACEPIQPDSASRGQRRGGRANPLVLEDCAELSCIGVLHFPLPCQ